MEQSCVRTGFGVSKNEARALRNRWVNRGLWAGQPGGCVQANACIDRATVGLSLSAKLNEGGQNLVQVGQVREWARIRCFAPRSTLAGFVSAVGNNVILAGQTEGAGHCSVGDGVVLTAQSAVSHNVPAGNVISRFPRVGRDRQLLGCGLSPCSSGCRNCFKGLGSRREGRWAAFAGYEGTPDGNGSGE